MKSWLAQLSASTRSLKSTLALYFIPISIIPTLSISFYAINLFQESTRETLVRRAGSERDAIVAELDTLETDLLANARLHAKSARIIGAASRKEEKPFDEAVAGWRPGLMARLYLPNGSFLAARRLPLERSRIDYLSKEGLRKVKARGETLERYYAGEGQGIVTLIRILVKDSKRVYGVLEEEYHFSSHDFNELKNRRQVDVAVLNREFAVEGASFALSNDMLKAFSGEALRRSLKPVRDPLYVTLGENRYATFIYDLPAAFGKQKQWGYLAVFLSLTTIDATTAKLKWALVYLTLLLILTATLAIFVFSNRLVKPIVVLVSAMKRMKTGRVEQIPSLDSTYEIEYLVSSFNDMTRNIAAAKQALEEKLEELHKANLEIKDTQSTLVQSAKMISLGQIVAGVAHELNNPIGFIYSNMHHLSEYLEKIRELVAAYQKLQAKLSEEDRGKMIALEKKLEIEFILKDMADLTQSCVEGAKRTKEIVLGLRSFSRVEESTFRLSDLHEGIRSTLKLLVTDIKDRVTVHESYGEVPFVECNLSQMNQVFMNLLSNAAHAIEGNGDIWIRTYCEGEEVVIEIEDNGIGISKDAIEKIFDPFFTTKKVGQGTGLGLSIAYGLVQKHHGNIFVTSEIGKGTKFTIRLPLRQPVPLTA